MTPQCLESWSMELQRFKGLSLQHCNSEAKVKARSQDWPGALERQFWSRGRGLAFFSKREGPWRSMPWTSSLVLYCYSLKEVVAPSNGGETLGAGGREAQT